MERRVVEQYHGIPIFEASALVSMNGQNRIVCSWCEAEPRGVVVFGTREEVRDQIDRVTAAHRTIEDNPTGRGPSDVPTSSRHGY
jgi:hypothetical protein